MTSITLQTTSPQNNPGTSTSQAQDNYASLNLERLENLVLVEAPVLPEDAFSKKNKQEVTPLKSGIFPAYIRTTDGDSPDQLLTLKNVVEDLDAAMDLSIDELIRQVSRDIAEINIENRFLAKENRTLARQGMVAAKLEQADKIRDAAIAQLVTAVATSLVTLAGSGMSMRASTKGMNTSNPVKAQNYTNLGMSWNMGTQAVSSLVGASGNLAVKEFEAQQTEAQADEIVYTKQAEDQQEFYTIRREDFKEALNIIKEVIRSKEQIISTISRSMGA